eukprot:6200037-Pleurochrysis_carterae.AAC.1
MPSPTFTTFHNHGVSQVKFITRCMLGHGDSRVPSRFKWTRDEKENTSDANTEGEEQKVQSAACREK